jgi:hypothetical protein
MNTKFKFLAPIMIALYLVLPACEQYNKDYAKQAENPEFMHAGVRRIMDIIRHDIFPPPVASRIHAYSAIAAYEALVPGFPEYQSLAGQLQDLKPCPQPETGKDYCYPLASINAMLIVGKQLVFSEGDIQELEESIFDDFKKMNMPPEVYDRSMAYGAAIAKHILDWSKGDNYAQTRSAPKFTIDTKIADRWRPTPPAYSDALEPCWPKIRCWVLDSAGQFLADPPLPFSTVKGSKFYDEAMVVYNTVKNLTPAQDSTAWYWDDNPFRMDVSGHLMMGVKKIAPGGHWMNIATQACRKRNDDIIRSAETYVKVSCAIADGFISSWKAKYTYNLIRPESYINQYIDPEWTPLIQTPPFPEHTSAHSTISGAAAKVLTDLYGDIPFSDSTEMEFGIPPRNFNSFNQAADQVAMSRLYGGIHYPWGNEAGLRNGRIVGEYVLNKLKTRKSGGKIGQQ